MFNKIFIELRAFNIKYIKGQRFKGQVNPQLLYKVYFEKELPMLQRLRGINEKS